MLHPLPLAPSLPADDASTTTIVIVIVFVRRHAVVKMKLFAQVLFLEKHYQLASAATAAYKRLRKKLGNEQ